MSNKLLTILALFVGVFYVGNVSAQFGWGTTAEKPKTEAMKTADQNMNATDNSMTMTPADKAATDATAPDATLAPTTGAAPDATTAPATGVEKDLKSDGDMMHKNGMTPAPYEKADMMVPAAGKSCQ